MKKAPTEGDSLPAADSAGVLSSVGAAASRLFRQPRGLIRNALEFSLGNGAVLGLNILRVAVAGRVLSTEAAGTWLGLQLLYAYAQNLHLGVFFGLFRELPMRRSRGDHSSAAAAKATTFTFSAALVALFLTAVAGVSFLHPFAQRRHLLGVAVLTVATVAKGYYVAVYKAESRFRELSVAAGLSGFLSLLSIGLIWVAGLDGLIWGMVLQVSFETGVLLRREGLPALRIDLRLLRTLLGVGFMTLLTALAMTLLTTVDRTVMLRQLGASAAGYYYLRANLVLLMPAVSALPFAVLTPLFFQRFGASNDPRTLVLLVEEPARFASVLFACLLGAGAIAVPALIAWIWPALTPGITATQLAMLAAFPIVMSGLVTNVFYALNRQGLHLTLILTASAAGLLAAGIGVWLRPTPAAAVAGALVGLLGFYGASALVTSKLMVGHFAFGVRLLGRSGLPLLVATALAGSAALASHHLHVASSLWFVGLAELLFLAVFLPWTLVALKRLRSFAQGVQTSQTDPAPVA